VKDRFSNHASQYAAFRPVYPQSLYDFILSHTRGRDTAWDCACGNGQVARDLAPHFKVVEATDISQKQIDNAHKASNIHYSVSPAEHTLFPDKTFDLITVGQAIHWFKLPEFFAEARRVAKDGGIIAYWGYALFRVNPEVDRIVDDFYVNVVGPYWDPERKLIDQHYSTIEFPFEKISAPEFDFSFEWTVEELRGYIATWSAVQKFIDDKGFDPVAGLMDRLRPVLPKGKVRVGFPLFVMVGRIKCE
jgi:SAM-dependent methyltransferase